MWKKYDWITYLNRYLFRFQWHNFWLNWAWNSCFTMNVAGGYWSWDRDLPAGTGGWITGHSVPSIDFFNKLFYRHKVNTYICHFRCIQESYPARLCQNSSFSVPASTVHISSAQIIQQGQVDIKPGVACPLFSFFHKIHYRHNLDGYINNSCYVQELYFARRRSSSSLFLHGAHFQRLNHHLDAHRSQ